MRKFYITSMAFEGAAEIMYSDDGLLVLVDLRNTSMGGAGVQRLLREIIPISINRLEECFKALPALMLVEAEFTVSLDDFHRAYPYKRNTHLLPPIWDKLGNSDRIRALNAATEYRKYCDRNSTWYKPKIAAAWLKDKEYLNDWKNM